MTIALTNCEQASRSSAFSYLQSFSNPRPVMLLSIVTWSADAICAISISGKSKQSVNRILVLDSSEAIESADHLIVPGTNIRRTLCT